MIETYSLAKLGRGYKLSKNITLGEFASKGADGSEPTPVDLELIEKVQQMRDLLGAAVHINSGYRTVKHNAAVGGVAGSYHTKGMAADIYFDGVSDEVAAQCAEYVGFGGIGLYPGRIHVDTRPGRYRYRKPGRDYIAVDGFPGFMPPAPEPETTERESEMRYKTVEELPEWAKPTITRLADKGLLAGRGEAGLDLSEDMIRLLIINDRAGVYARPCCK